MSTCSGSTVPSGNVALSVLPVGTSPALNTWPKVAAGEVCVVVVVLVMVNVVTGVGTKPVAIVTVADCVALPPVPVQAKVNVLPLVNAPLLDEPDIALLPDQAPVAVQLVALLDDQVSVVDPPAITDAGDALILTVGAGVVPLTFTVVDCEVDPPAPAQVSVKVLALVSAALVSNPVVPLVPVHAPLAVQVVALLEDQLSDVVPPLLTVVGLALNVTVGTAGAATVTEIDRLALPPAPVQFSV